MPSDNEHASPHDFLKKMDAGDFDNNLVREIKKLSREQLEEVAKALVERSKRGGYAG